MAETVLPYETIILDRWLVEERIGKGGFGAVYRCKDRQSNKIVALKLVFNNVNSGIIHLNNEAKALRAVQGKKFFTRYFSYGSSCLCHFLAMELLGPNLKNLQKALPGRKFSIDATLSMGRMMLKSIEWLHEAGYLHRDIKPSNFAIGVKEKANRVYLIDFGLSKQYVSDNGELFALRNKVTFKGTARYASANVLNGKDAGRRDDLISLFYTLIELSVPKLPWKDVTCRKEMATMKESYDHSTLTVDFPAIFLHFFEQSNMLGALQKPDYGLLLSILEHSLMQLSMVTSNSICVRNNGIPHESYYLNNNALSPQARTDETTITGDIISGRMEDFKDSWSG